MSFELILASFLCHVFNLGWFKNDSN